MDGTYFNSIKVQLEPNKAYFMKRLDDYFNSIKVQLELQEDSSSFYMRKNFNSIKVQLERHTSYMPADRNPFQFHKGTIRTLWQTQLRRSIAHFNSIKVQLELAVQPNLLYIFRNFNSIKVQLELSSLFSRITCIVISIP